MRDFAEYKTHISTKTMRVVIVSLVELVEYEVAEEIKEKKGCILHDGDILEEVWVMLLFLHAT